jgi:iron complex outermembrane receptor protein
MSIKNWSIILSLFTAQITFAQNMKGTVIDKETEKGIPFAKVYFIELQNGTICDSIGNWELSNTINGQMTLQISSDEFETKLVKLKEGQTEITISLEHAHLHLDEVIISTSDSKLQRYSTYPVDSRKIADLNKIEQTTLIDALSNMPGIYNQSIGNGISKPVIRGLSGMRVLTSQNGLRLENQQWGADHGFAVLNLGIDRAEVIKGPSSLIYGADALGGVIYIADEAYADDNESELKASTKFETNSMATTNKISFKSSKNNLRFAVYGGYFNRSDYRLGDSSAFEVNNSFVNNSQNSGASFKTAIGYNKNNWITNFRYQLLSFRNGLPGHTHDSIWDVSDFISSQQDRKEGRPAQFIINHLAQWENKFYFKEDEVVAQLGFTSNGLQEYERIFTPELNMNLQNYSYNFKWKHKLNEQFDIISGSQGMMQSSTNGAASDTLITDTDYTDLGAYSLLKGTFGIWNIQAGARYDQRNVKTFESINPFSKNYDGFNYSIGISRSSENFTTRLNASSGFRPPHISELLANGVHHATAQFLIGDRTLKSERANQIDFYLGMHREHLEIIVNPFVNQIDNFIYNDPIGENDSYSGLPIFDIKRTNALLYGGDIALHYHPHIAHWMHLESNFSLLKTEDQLGNPLPQIPQNRINNTIKVDINSNKKFKINSISAQYVYNFKQDQIVTYEIASSDYHLINIGCTGTLNTNNKMGFSFGINNLMNKNYIDHLSLIKYYGIPNAGRNFYVKLNLIISKSK